MSFNFANTTNSALNDQRLLMQVLIQTADSVVISNTMGLILFINPAFEQITGYKSSEALGRTHSLINSGVHSEAFFLALWTKIVSGQEFRGVITNRRKNGAIYQHEQTITPICDEEGEITHFVSIGRDVTDRQHANQRLEYLANHDLLTGLPNRGLFMDRLAQAMARCEREGLNLALFFIDVDHFKTINDSHGHSVGDDVLAEVARRLRSAMRNEDTVARLGGDEFTIIAERLEESTDSHRIGQAILAAFEAPFEIDGRTFSITISVGIAIFPNDSTDLMTLLKHADIAMFYAKASNRCNFAHFSEIKKHTALKGHLLNEPKLPAEGN